MKLYSIYLQLHRRHCLLIDISLYLPVKWSIKSWPVESRCHMHWSTAVDVFVHCIPLRRCSSSTTDVYGGGGVGGLTNRSVGFCHSSPWNCVEWPFISWTRSNKLPVNTQPSRLRVHLMAFGDVGTNNNATDEPVMEALSNGPMDPQWVIIYLPLPSQSMLVQ